MNVHLIFRIQKPQACTIQKYSVWKTLSYNKALFFNRQLELYSCWGSPAFSVIWLSLSRFTYLAREQQRWEQVWIQGPSQPLKYLRGPTPHIQAPFSPHNACRINLVQEVSQLLHTLLIATVSHLLPHPWQNSGIISFWWSCVSKLQSLILWNWNSWDCKGPYTDSWLTELSPASTDQRVNLSSSLPAVYYLSGSSNPGLWNWEPHPFPVFSMCQEIRWN